MRKRFSVQLELGQKAIEEVKIPTNSRDELPPILSALQWIFETPAVNELIFELLEKKVRGEKKQTGRPGMDYWQILVLGVVRLGLDCDYDRLGHVANYDMLVRQIMGLSPSISDDGSKQFHAKTLCENINHVDDELLSRINAIIAEHGRKMIKKKDGEKIAVKTDTYVVESNVHFPTDLNLLWDANRKVIELCVKLAMMLCYGGWRKQKDWKRRLKALMRTCGKACQGGGKNKEKRVRDSARKYLNASDELELKVSESIAFFSKSALNPATLVVLNQLIYFHEMQKKHIDLIRRRLLEDETIPSGEKLYSLFEPHTEWINKGKQRPPIELGHKLQIATDQYGFILDYTVLESVAESETILPLVERLLEKYGQDSIGSFSVDKGGSSKEVAEILSSLIPDVIMPKRGKKNKEEQELEGQKRFRELRNAHSAVESNINSLEHHGLNRCPDKGLKGFKRYTGFGILSYNLHKIGNVILRHRRETAQKKAA